MNVERYEKAFLAVSAVMLAAFLAALAWSSLVMGIHLPAHAGHLDPRAVAQTPPFDKPGVREVEPGRYEVVIVGTAWQFAPAEIRVPAGAEVRFRATSGDVVHGFVVEGTRLNLMLVPGHVSEATYRFERPGEHLFLCHEYCGAAHHIMFGKVIVQ